MFQDRRVEGSSSGLGGLISSSVYLPWLLFGQRLSDAKETRESKVRFVTYSRASAGSQEARIERRTTFQDSFLYFYRVVFLSTLFACIQKRFVYRYNFL